MVDGRWTMGTERSRRMDDALIVYRLWSIAYRLWSVTGDGQHQVRRVLGGVEHLLISHGQLGPGRQVVPDVAVAVVLGEGAGADLQADGVAFLEHLRCVPEVQ